MKKYSLRTLMKLVLVAAVACWVIDATFFSWKREAERAIRQNSTTTKFHEPLASSYSAVRAQEKSYSLGDYGICEIANTRIAVRGYAHRGSTGSSSHIVLATKSSLTGGGGGYGGTGHNFSSRSIAGGTHCTFGPIAFDIVDGTLHIDDREFDIIHGSQLIIIDRNGKVEDTAKIPVYQDPPQWISVKPPKTSEPPKPKK